MPDTPAVRISVWSDDGYPSCDLELPVLDRLQTELRDQVAVDWRSFELRHEPVPTRDRNGVHPHRVRAQSVTPTAAQRSMVLHPAPVQPRSRKALEAAEFARAANRFDPLHRGLFEDGRDIGDSEVLADIADTLGPDTQDRRGVLATSRHTQKVLSDQQLAHEIGISDVPALLSGVDDKGTLVRGVQPYEVVRNAVERARRAGPVAAQESSPPDREAKEQTCQPPRF